MAFQNGFRSTRSTADLLTVVSDRIAKSGATQAVALDISRTFDSGWHVGLLYKLESYGISGQIFGLFYFFFSWLGVTLDGKSSKNIWLMVKFVKAPFLDLHFCYYTLMAFRNMLSVILLSMLMIILSTLSVIKHLICGNN